MSDDELDHFNDLVAYISERAPIIESISTSASTQITMTTVTHNNNVNKSPITDTTAAKTEGPSSATAPTRKDYSHLYVYKSAIEQTNAQKKNTDSFGSSDFISFSDEHTGLADPMIQTNKGQKRYTNTTQGAKSPKRSKKTFETFSALGM